MSGYGKQYLMSGIRKTVFDYWTLILFSLNNLNDASFILMPGVQWDINDDIALNFDGFINIGDEKDSEFGSMYSTVQGKIQAYF